MEVVVKLKSILEERGITQKELAKMTDLREATISEISRSARGSINTEHLLRIATALDITELKKLVDFK